MYKNSVTYNIYFMKYFSDRNIIQFPWRNQLIRRQYLHLHQTRNEQILYYVILYHHSRVTVIDNFHTQNNGMIHFNSGQKLCGYKYLCK